MFSVCLFTRPHTYDPQPLRLVFHSKEPEGHYEGVNNLIFHSGSVNIVAMCRLNKLLGLAYLYISLYLLSCRSHI